MSHERSSSACAVMCALATASSLLVGATHDNTLRGSGSIQGLTVYEDGQALPGTTVTLSRGTSRVASTYTSRQGTYELPNVAAGNYTIEFSLPGFIAVRCPVLVKADTTATSSGAISVKGIDTGEPSPDDERHRVCFGEGEIPVFMEVRAQSQPSRTLILVADIGHAPNAAGYFLKHIKENAFDQGRVQRVPTAPMPGSASRRDRSVSSLIEAISKETLAIEAGASFESTQVSGLRHRAGALSWPQPTSTQSRPAGFMILLDDDASFDAGSARYPNRQGAAAFGRLAIGLRDLKQWDSSPLMIVAIKPAGWMESRRVPLLQAPF